MCGGGRASVCGARARGRRGRECLCVRACVCGRGGRECLSHIRLFVMFVLCACVHVCAGGGCAPLSVGQLGGLHLSDSAVQHVARTLALFPAGQPPPPPSACSRSCCASAPPPPPPPSTPPPAHTHCHDAAAVAPVRMRLVAACTTAALPPAAPRGPRPGTPPTAGISTAARVAYLQHATRR